jgi:hypothetical protein
MTAMNDREINELMIDARAQAIAQGKKLLVCPIDECEWTADNIKSSAKELRRHLVASH